MESGEAPYRFEDADGYSVLSLYPLINDGNWGNVSQVGAEILNRLEATKSPALVVDLSPLDYMGSAQVALLVRVWKSLKKTEGRMAVQCPGQMVGEVLSTAGLKSLWEIVETREEAVASLGFQSRAEQGQHFWCPILAIALLVAAGIVVGLVTSGTRDVAMIWTAIGLGVASALIGGLTILLQQGGWRAVGGVVSLAGIGLVAYTWTQFPPM